MSQDKKSSANAEESSHADDAPSGESQRLYVGPAQTSWCKFRLGKIVYRATNNPLGRRVPLLRRARLWAFKTIILSRDFEEVPTDE